MLTNPGRYVPIKGTFFIEHNVNNNLTFTHNLNDMNYRTNDGGRDSYIYSNNGGFYKTPQSQKSEIKKVGFPSPKKPQVTLPTISDFARPVHYRANNGGRDSYIYMTDGGFSHPTNP